MPEARVGPRPDRAVDDHVVLLLAACASIGPAAAPAPGSGPSVAPSATDVALLDEAALAALLSNPGSSRLVVNFWASWCGPCVAEMDVMRTAAAGAPGVRFALVSVDEPAAVHLVAPFLAARSITLPAYQLADPDASGVLSRQVPGWPDIIPVTLVLDPGGAIHARFDGAVDLASLRAALEP